MVLMVLWNPFTTKLSALKNLRVLRKSMLTLNIMIRNTMTLTAYLSNPIYLTYIMVPLQTLIPNGPLLPLFLRLILTHDEFIIHNYGLNKFTNRYLLKEIGFY